MIKKILIALGLLLLLVAVFHQPLLQSIKPLVNDYLMSFPESEYRDAEAEGSWPQRACQNSHSNWGEQVRLTQSLDGDWQLAQGDLDDAIPGAFDYRVAVPGFVSEARPAFAKVGVESDEREAFWYRTSFDAPQQARSLAVLCLGKAKYGAKVWLNGVPLGMHHGAYTLSEYLLSDLIRYGESNELVIRIGAEHSAVPEFIPIGADLEKYAFHPGIWDSVNLVYTGVASIVSTRVEPDIDRGRVRVHTRVRNNGDAPLELSLAQQIRESQAADWMGDESREVFQLGGGQARTLTQEVELDAAHLWSPEDPFLYVVQSNLSSADRAMDDRATRFGMRKFEWKSGRDKGFFLNNKRYYLRGTNIALHRFFEDPDRGLLPWSEEWVRQLLSGHMKDFHWNSFRFHLGRAPNFWYDIADEVGLIVADEFHVFAPIVLGVPGMPSSLNWSLVELRKEFEGWIRENWNHASIGWWDASNETHNPLFYEVVPLVRDLDPTRAWESGSYRAADRRDDPLEEHPYKLNGTGFLNSNSRDYVLADFDDFSRQPPMALGGIFSTWDGSGARDHAYINNEYGWLWLTRDGSNATPIAESAYELLAPGVDLSSEERREIYAYVASELSGYWRAGRGYAGIQHFLYLGKCLDVDDIGDDDDITEPSATCDNFIDIPRLQMEPRWARWAPQAFAPVAINIDLWSEEAYPAGTTPVAVTLLNDTYGDETGTVSLLLADAAGNILSRSEPVTGLIPALGREHLQLDIVIPEEGPFVIYASLDGGFAEQPVFSRRKVGFEHPGVLVTLPGIVEIATGKGK